MELCTPMKKFFSKTHVFCKGHFRNQWALQKAHTCGLLRLSVLKTDALVECMTNFAALFKDKLFFTFEKCTVLIMY